MKKISTVVVSLLVAAFCFAAEPVNLLKDPKKPESWRTETHETAKAKTTVDDESLKVEITTVDGTDWHVQLVNTGLDLKDGNQYVLKFKARADADRQVPINAMIDQDDWHQIGLSETADVTKDWKTFEYEFKAEQTADKKNRISLILGADKGAIWLRDVTLTEKGK